MSDAPERIWAVQGIDGVISFNDYDNGQQEYIRADLPPPPEQIMADPRVKALVEAVQVQAGLLTSGTAGDRAEIVGKRLEATLAAIKETKE